MNEGKKLSHWVKSVVAVHVKDVQSLPEILQVPSIPWHAWCPVLSYIPLSVLDIKKYNIIPVSPKCPSNKSLKFKHFNFCPEHWQKLYILDCSGS